MISPILLAACSLRPRDSRASEAVIEKTQYIINQYIHSLTNLCLSIYGRVLRPATPPPPWYGPGRSIGPGTWHAFTAPSLGYLPPFLPLFPHLIEFLANTIGFYTICKDYDSINQHSHPSTTTPPTPTGGEAGNHDHPQKGGGAAQGCAICLYIF